MPSIFSLGVLSRPSPAGEVKLNRVKLLAALLVALGDRGLLSPGAYARLVPTKHTASCRGVPMVAGSPAVPVVASRHPGAACAQAAEKEAAWFDLKVNTSVYVQGLPDDVTEAEMVQARPARDPIRPGQTCMC